MKPHGRDIVRATILQAKVLTVDELVKSLHGQEGIFEAGEDPEISVQEVLSEMKEEKAIRCSCCVYSVVSDSALA